MSDRFDEFHGQYSHAPFSLTGTAATTIAAGITAGSSTLILTGGFIVSSGDVGLTIKDTAGNHLGQGSGAPLALGRGIVFPHNPAGHCAPTAVGEGIVLQLDATGKTVGGCLTFKIQQTALP